MQLSNYPQKSSEVWGVRFLEQTQKPGSTKRLKIKITRLWAQVFWPHSKRDPRRAFGRSARWCAEVWNRYTAPLKLMLACRLSNWNLNTIFKNKNKFKKKKKKREPKYLPNKVGPVLNKAKNLTGTYNNLNLFSWSRTKMTHLNQFKICQF